MFLLRFFTWKVLLLAFDTIVHPKASRDSFTKHRGSQSPGVVVILREMSLPSVMRMRMRSSARAVAVLGAGLGG
jgi:hypothetical protein